MAQVTTRQQETLEAALVRLADKARAEGVTLQRDSRTVQFYATSGTVAGKRYEVSAYACTCQGNQRHGYCKHMAAVAPAPAPLPDRRRLRSRRGRIPVRRHVGEQHPDGGLQALCRHRASVRRGKDGGVMAQLDTLNRLAVPKITRHATRNGIVSYAMRQPWERR